MSSSPPVSTTLGALNATTGKRQVRDGYVTVVVGGTFVGTLTARVTPSGGELASGATEPASVAESVTITAPGRYTYGPYAGRWDVDVAMTAYTSGAANVAIGAGSFGVR